VCSTANGWDEGKQLLRLSTLLKGWTWAVYEALGNDETDSYAHLKAVLLVKLSPDTDECKRETGKQTTTWGQWKHRWTGTRHRETVRPSFTGTPRWPKGQGVKVPPNEHATRKGIISTEAPISPRIHPHDYQSHRTVTNIPICRIQRLTSTDQPIHHNW